MLEGRRVTFVEPLPSQRVCCVCDVVSSVTTHLPCCHVLCNGPCGSVFERRDDHDCPVDGHTAEENDVVVVTSSLVELEQLEVFCINRACDFKGTLRLMMQHFLLCEYSEGVCGKCGETMTREAAARHGWDCKPPASQAAPLTSPDRSAVVRIAADLRSSTESLCALELRDGWDTAVTVGVTSLEALTHQIKELLRRLARVQVSVRGAAGASFVAPGPCRGPSEPGASVILCELDVKQKIEEYVSINYTLAGYAFYLVLRYGHHRDARLVRDAHRGSLKLHIIRGRWDSCVRWPFEKRVTLTIPHLRDRRMDVDIAMNALPAHSLKRSPSFYALAHVASFQSVERVPWEKLFEGNYVHENMLHVHVEFA